ncbi:MAG: hypothetical protein ACRCSW_12790 [Tabrizicola sp.]
MSAAVGVLVMVSTLVLSLPTWVTLAAYPAFCSLAMLFFAAMHSIRISRASRNGSFARV